jgi:predicted transcriptional regulator
MDIDTKHRSLTKSELHLMNLLWDKGEGTVNDLIEMMPEPRPAYTTVLTVMRVLTKKGVVEATPQGKAYLYKPLMTREEYTKGFMEETRNTLFKGSLKNLLLYFARKEKISKEELIEILAVMQTDEKQDI